jgi:hypothetical protein
MAARTIILAQTDGCTATLNWNDTTNTATTITVDNTLGDQAVTFYVVTGGVHQSSTVQPGSTGTIAFPTARSVTIDSPKPGSIVITGLTSFGIGTGAGIGT